jgi:hypothetical protein
LVGCVHFGRGIIDPGLKAVTDSPDRKGSAAQLRGGSAESPLRPDEQAIMDALRQAEAQHHAAIVVAYYNGSHWLLYAPGRPTWLDKG